MAVVKKNAAAAVPAAGESAAAPAATPKVSKIKATKAAAPKVTKAAAPKPVAASAAPAATAHPSRRHDDVPQTGVESAKVGRKDLAKAIYEKVKATGKAVPLGIAEIMVVAYEEVVVEAVSQGFEVNLPGFGKYVVSVRPETERRNPATGEKFMVPAHNVVRFKVGSSLKAAVSDTSDEGDQEGGEAA